MKRLLPSLTYANVVATVCLVLLVGGGTAYAAKHLLPKNSVGAGQLKKGAVTPLKLSKAAKTALLGAEGPRGAVGPAGAPGARGETGASGSAKGWARVSNTGAILASSGNVTVSKVGTGDYCVTAGAFNSTNSVAVATPDNSDPVTVAGDTVVIAEAELSNDCPKGAGDFDVLGTDSGGGEGDLGFVIIIS